LAPNCGDFGGDEAVAGVDGADERSAFDELVSGCGEETAAGRAAERVAGATDALQERRDSARRSDLVIDLA